MAAPKMAKPAGLFLTIEEAKLLKESLKYSKESASKKGIMYFSIDGYKENVFNPRMAMYESILGKVECLIKAPR